jgi:cytoskeletal protein RodZ
VLRGFDDYELTAGDVIRGARATMGLDIATVAEKLRLSPEVLREIEEGVYSGSYPDYLMNNIVRDYAKFLNLDPHEVRVLYWRDVELRYSRPAEAGTSQTLRKPPRTRMFQALMHRLGFWRNS